MGDSAGAGMVVALLIIIREMGLPMPAGASLISPWVDLTHSMPSIGGWDGGDFIPNTGCVSSHMCGPMS
jgi:acetyl esterase/lipase